MRISYQLRIIVFATFLLLGSMLVLPSLLPHNIRAQIVDSPIARQFLPVYRSLRKLPDLAFVPYLFTPTRIERIDIVIDPRDIRYLNAFLPQTQPFTGVNLDKGRVFTGAYFTGEDYSDRVDIRYKGLGANHWNSFKKSYRIKFPDEHLYQKASGLNLVIPEDKAYYADLLAAYRAKKLGVITKNLRLAQVTINGQNHGVYLASDHWSPAFLEGRRIPDSANILGLDDGSEELLPGGSFENYKTLKAFSPEYVGAWKSYTRDTEGIVWDEIRMLAEVVTHTDDKTFERLIGNIVDLENFYRWNIIHVLAGNPMVDYENIVMIFNTATGRFEFALVDVYATRLRDGYVEESELVRRILSVEAFKNRRDALLLAYIEDSDEIADDLAYYDALYEDTRSEFFKDHAKRDTSFSYNRRVREVRDIFAENVVRADIVVQNDYRSLSNGKEKGVASFGGNFERFGDTGLSRDVFLARNPWFVSRGVNGVALLPGRYVFDDTIIIPAGVTLTIDPGVTLYLGEDTSFLSYGDIQAVGTSYAPISVLRKDPEAAWGTFGVINASGTSTLSRVIINGGSGASINGVIFTGMASFHNASVSIKNSSFIAGADDDGLNVKYGTAVVERSTFSGNASDAIDFDFVSPASVIRDNIFKDNGFSGGGDAIDLSWSDILISENIIDGCNDKGVSVGEHSFPLIESNRITHCDIGIAVKDLSEAIIVGNYIADVRVGVAVYAKKTTFGGGIARTEDNVFERVFIWGENDEFSNIEDITAR